MRWTRRLSTWYHALRAAGERCAQKVRTWVLNNPRLAFLLAHQCMNCSSAHLIGFWCLFLPLCFRPHHLSTR